MPNVSAQACQTPPSARAGRKTSTTTSDALRIVGAQISAVGRSWCSSCQRLNGATPCRTKRCSRYSITVQLAMPSNVSAADAGHCPGGAETTSSTASATTAEQYRACLLYTSDAADEEDS